MADGTMKPATNVVELYNEEIQFKVDDALYKVFKNGHEVIKLKIWRYGDAEDWDWLITKEVDCLCAFDEKESKDMNYFHSVDFNAGVIYGKIELGATKLLLEDDKLNKAFVRVVIPKTQFFPSSHIDADIITMTHRAVEEHFEAVYGRYFTLSSTITMDDLAEKYIAIKYVVTRKVQYKEMTVAEIEKALGYKIKVIGEPKE